MSWDYRRIHLLPGSKLKQKTQNCHSSSDCERAYLAHVVWQIAASVLVQNFNSHSTVLVFQVQTSRLARRQRLKKQIHTFAEWYSQGIYSALGHTVTDNFPLSLLPEYYQLLSSAGRAEGGEPLRWQSKAGELNCFHTYLRVGDASTCIFAIGLKMICLQAWSYWSKSVASRCTAAVVLAETLMAPHSHGHADLNRIKVLQTASVPPVGTYKHFCVVVGKKVKQAKCRRFSFTCNIVFLDYVVLEASWGSDYL